MLSFLSDGARESSGVAWIDPSSTSCSDSTGSAGSSAVAVASSTGPFACVDDS